jgi:hypothetical protein
MQENQDNDDLPSLRVAVICHTTIEDKQDDTLSLIKIFDGVTVNFVGDAATEPGTSPAQITLTVVIGTLAGTARGKRALSMRVRLPDGVVRYVASAPGSGHEHHYDEDTAVRNWIVRLTLTVTTSGLHWIEVLCDEQPFTRLPLKIAFAALSTESPARDEA